MCPYSPDTHSSPPGRAEGRERVCVCERERERKRVCVCVCVREIEREREGMRGRDKGGKRERDRERQTDRQRQTDRPSLYTRCLTVFTQNLYPSSPEVCPRFIALASQVNKRQDALLDLSF